MAKCAECNKKLYFFTKSYLDNDTNKVYCKECKELVDLEKKGVKLEKGRAICCVCELNIDNKIFVLKGNKGYYCKDHAILQKKKEQKDLDKKKRSTQDLVNKKEFKIAKKITLFTTYSLPINNSILHQITNSYLVLEKGKVYSLKNLFIDFSNKVNLDLLSNCGFQVIKSTPSTNKLIITPNTELKFLDKHPVYSVNLYKKLDLNPNLKNKKYCTKENFYSGLKLSDKISFFVKNYGSDTIVTTKDYETQEYNRQHNILDIYFISDSSYFILREIWVAHEHMKYEFFIRDKTIKEIIIEIENKDISTRILPQLFEYLKRKKIQEKEIVWDRGNSYASEKIKIKIHKIIPSNSDKISENTIIKNFIKESGINAIYVNNTNISIPSLCCDLKVVKTKPLLKNQKPVETFEKLKSIIDLIGNVFFYENEDELIYYNEELYFIFDKKLRKPKFR